MSYVKLSANGSVERYPYTLTELKRETPNVSFPSQLSDEDAADFGLYPVTPAEQPAYDYRKNLERTAVQGADGWVEQWTEVDASAEEIAQRTEVQSSIVRGDRNQRLTNSDWTQLADNTADTNAWAAYRQALRDLPAQPGFPHNVTWPTEPTT